MLWGAEREGGGLGDLVKTAVQQGKVEVSPLNHRAEVLGELLGFASNPLHLW